MPLDLSCLHGVPPSTAALLRPLSPSLHVHPTQPTPDLCSWVQEEIVMFRISHPPHHESSSRGLLSPTGQVCWARILKAASHPQNNLKPVAVERVKPVHRKRLKEGWALTLTLTLRAGAQQRFAALPGPCPVFKGKTQGLLL